MTADVGGRWTILQTLPSAVRNLTFPGSRVWSVFKGKRTVGGKQLREDLNDDVRDPLCPRTSPAPLLSTLE